MINLNEEGSEEFYELQARLLGSLLYFTQVFYKLRTGRDFNITKPIGRESHQITICRKLTKCFRLEIDRLLINIEPGSGKSELLKHFVAWGMAHYADSNFIYVSYSHDLSSGHTADIRKIMSLPFYRKMFDVELDQRKNANDDFMTTKGGRVFAAGSEGTITGVDAGLPIDDRFSGALIMDDMHKPTEGTSDGVREKVKANYGTTLTHRPRSMKVPRIFLGQRIHEADLPAMLINGEEGFEWNKVILKSIDEAGNVLNPGVHDKHFLAIMEKNKPYDFFSQYQQTPQPPGGGIWKKDEFVLLDIEPDILTTFITADTAATEKRWNDATVFSFWGIYKIRQADTETNIYGLHWLDCRELRVEPKHLYNEFMDFYRNCLRYSVPPSCAAIEKKSTGVTLVSVLKDLQGLRVIDIDRTHSKEWQNTKEKNSVKTLGSKTDRFISIQSYIYSGRVSLPKYGNHTEMCVEHCGKITANAAQAHDDIADTLYDAVKIALIDKVIVTFNIKREGQEEKKVIDTFAAELKRQMQRSY